MSKPLIAAVALGSNLGDRHAHLAFARDRLAALLANLRMSSIHETAPVDVAEAQPMFLNAAAVGETTLGAPELLAGLLAIERARGRERPFVGAARTLDLDLILLGDIVMDEPSIHVPHPRFRDRLFVLEPLAEVGPDLRDPITRLTVADLLARCRQAPRAPAQ